MSRCAGCGYEHGLVGGWCAECIANGKRDDHPVAAARLPERPDDCEAPDCGAKDGIPCGTCHPSARLPERPDEGSEPRSRLRMMAHTRGFCPICSQAVPSRPADEGVTEAIVEAAAKAIARQAEPMRTDGFDWDRLTATAKGTYKDWARGALAARRAES